MNCCELHKNGKYKHWNCGKYDALKRHFIYIQHKGICRICGKECSQFNNRCKECYSLEQGKRMKGKKLSRQWIENIKKGQRIYYGKRGRKTILAKRIKSTMTYKEWRKQVFQRDNWTCQDCGQKGNRLHPHHIKSFSKILNENKIKTLEESFSCEELWDINNGITLCHICHKKTPTYGQNSSIKCWQKF